MPTNSIQKSFKRSHNYLANLITIFNQIHSQISRLPNFQPATPIQLNDIVSSLSSDFELVQRQVKKQNEIKLFQETLQMVQQLHNKNNQIRKADAIMQCLHVADILKNRIINQLHIRGQARTKVIDSIQLLKDHMISWGQKEHRRPQQQTEKASIHYGRKSTERYTVKYVFNEETRPSTTNITQADSVTYSKIKLHDIFTNSQIVSRQKHPQRDIQKHLKQSKITKTSTSRVQAPKKSNQTDNKTSSKKSLIRKQRYAVNYSKTEYQTKLNTLLNAESQTYIMKKDDDNDSERSSEEEDTEQQQQQSQLEPNDYKMKEGHHLKQIKLNNKAYNKSYNNQNFTRSNDTIVVEGTTLNKPKQSIQTTKEEITYKQQIQHTEKHNKYKTGKYLARRGIRNGNLRLYRPTNTDKALANIKAIMHKGKPHNSTQKQPYLPLSMLPKQRESNQFQHKHESQLDKSYKSQLNNAPIIIQPLINQQCIGNHHQQSKKLTDYYSLLSQMRAQFNKAPNQYFQDRSVFFHQQNLLRQQQKRKLDRIHEEQQNRYDIHTFDLKKSVTNLSDEKLLKSARNDTFNYGCRFFKQRIIEKLAQAQFGPEKTKIIN